MNANERKAIHATVHGHVQGVGFRYFVRNAAERLALDGWVRNLADGRSVEVIAAGSSSALESLLAELRTGPPGAEVDQVDVTWTEPQSRPDGFRILV